MPAPWHGGTRLVDSYSIPPGSPEEATTGGSFKACIAFGFLLAYDAPTQTRTPPMILDPGSKAQNAPVALPTGAEREAGRIDREPGSASGLTVWVINQAEMPGGELERARQEADRILSHAGVTMEWVVCPVSGTAADGPPRCQDRPAVADLFLRILPGLPDFSVVGPSKGYAYALVPTDGGYGFLADVYLKGAEALARSDKRLRAVFLGHMMAHEVGHLLLGPGHSGAGIMHCPWSSQSHELAAQGFLLFLLQEAKRMRAAVGDRMRATQRTEAAQVGTLAASGLESRSGQDRAELRITVYVYNPAKVPSTMLEQARREVMRIYRAAGVEVGWVDCPCETEELDNYPRCRPNQSTQVWLAVRIIPRSMIGGVRLDPSGFGRAALREEGEFGKWAYVCFQCAERLLEVQNDKLVLERRPEVHGMILGALMAHELGHLVLATTRHSSFGIMRPHWNRADLEDAARGLMLFTAEEARRIRARVRDRMRAEDDLGVANLRARQ